VQGRREPAAGRRPAHRLGGELRPPGRSGRPGDLTPNCKASIQISGPSGTVPGLGDANCYGVDGVTPSVGATVLVRKGRFLLLVSAAMVGVTKDGIVRLARIAVDRLP
jgi:hypothetical protein